MFFAATLLVSLAAAAGPFSHRAPTKLPAGEVFVLEGILDDAESYEGLVLRVRPLGGEYQDFRLALEYGDLYRGQIPAERVVPPAIEYYVEGINEAGERRALYMSSERPARVQVISGKAKAAEVPSTEERSERAPPDVPQQEKGRTRLDQLAPPSSPAPKVPEKKEPEKAAEKPPPLAPEPKAQKPAAIEEKKAEPLKASSEPPMNTALTLAETIASSTTYTFTAEQIRRLGVRRLSELLEFVPGMSSQRDVQGFTRTGLRGLAHDGDVLVLVDGFRRNSLYDGRPLFDWPLANAKQVAVRLASAYDVGAPGNFRAVVRITTARSESVQAEVAGVFPLGVEAHASAHTGTGNVRFFADADVSSANGLSRPISSDAIDVEAKAQQLRPPDGPAGFTDESALFVQALGGLEWDRADQGTLRLTGRYGFERRGALVGAYSTVSPDSSLQTQAIDAQLQYRRKLSARVTLDAEAWFEQHNALRIFQVSPSGFQTSAAREGFFAEGIREWLRFRERGLGAEVHATFEASKEHRLMVGLSAERTGLYDYWHATNLADDDTHLPAMSAVQPELLVPGVTPEPVLHRVSTGAFGDYRWFPVRALALNVSARAQLLQVPQVTEGEPPTQMRWLPVFSPRLGVAFHPVDSWVTRLSYAHGATAASQREQFEGAPAGTLNAGRPPSNPALAGFENDSVELGTLWQTGVRNGRARVEAVLFFERVAPIVQAVTARGVHIFGGEGHFRVDLSSRAGAALSLSAAKASSRDAPEGESAVPWFTANAQVTVPLGPNLSVDANARFGASRLPLGAPPTETYVLPAYVRFGLQVRSDWLLREHLQITGGIYDISFGVDADPAAAPVTMPQGIPRQPFNARLTLRYKL